MHSSGATFGFVLSARTSITHMFPFQFHSILEFVSEYVGPRITIVVTSISRKYVHKFQAITFLSFLCGADNQGNQHNNQQNNNQQQHSTSNSCNEPITFSQNSSSSSPPPQSHTASNAGENFFSSSSSSHLSLFSCEQSHYTFTVSHWVLFIYISLSLIALFFSLLVKLYVTLCFHCVSLFTVVVMKLLHFSDTICVFSVLSFNSFHTMPILCFHFSLFSLLFKICFQSISSIASWLQFFTFFIASSTHFTLTVFMICFHKIAVTRTVDLVGMSSMAFCEIYVIYTFHLLSFYYNVQTSAFLILYYSRFLHIILIIICMYM